MARSAARFVKKVRKKTLLSQHEFANVYGLSVRTLQKWEQGYCAPDGAARSYLRAIRGNPAAVRAALKTGGKK